MTGKAETAARDDADKAYMIWDSRLLYRRHANTIGIPEIYDYRSGSWRPSPLLRKTLHGVGGLEQESSPVDPKILPIGLALDGSPPAAPFPVDLMDGVREDLPGHAIFLKLMAGGGELTDDERTMVDHAINWFTRDQ